MAEIPVITSNLPQMQTIIEEYKVGFTVEENDVEQLKVVLNKLKTDKQLYFELKYNCKTASQVLCWEDEIKKLFPFL
jgi:glycosyltransferase involved in cell wall biosynthesis